MKFLYYIVSKIPHISEISVTKHSIIEPQQDDNVQEFINCIAYKWPLAKFVIVDMNYESPDLLKVC